MNHHTFWRIIDTARAEAGTDNQAMLTLVQSALVALPESDIRAFDDVMREYLSLSYRMDLWRIVVRILGYCSDDWFDYFRAWLISQGERMFRSVMRNPEVIAEFINKDSEWALEEFMYVAHDAYEEKTGIDWYEKMEAEWEAAKKA